MSKKRFSRALETIRKSSFGHISIVRKKNAYLTSISGPPDVAQKLATILLQSTLDYLSAHKHASDKALSLEMGREIMSRLDPKAFATPNYRDLPWRLYNGYSIEGYNSSGHLDEWAANGDVSWIASFAKVLQETEKDPDQKLRMNEDFQRVNVFKFVGHYDEKGDFVKASDISNWKFEEDKYKQVKEPKS